MSPIPTTTLPSGTIIPILAFGTDAKRASDPFDQARANGILNALNLGYTHIDSAAIYHTDPEAGWALAHRDSSAIPRSKLFITSKTHTSLGIKNKDIGSDLRKTLKEMGIDYVDLYLIHNPFFPNPKEFGLKEAWAQMEHLKEIGLTREIGVSNFEPVDLQKLLKVAKVKPAVNQIELHPNIYEESKPVIDYCKSHSITIEGYSPLMILGRASKSPILSSSRLPRLLDSLSSRYSKSSAQILLKWSLQRGFIPVSSSMKEERQKEQIGLWGWELSEEDLRAIESAGSEVSFRYFGWGDLGRTKYESVFD